MTYIHQEHVHATRKWYSDDALPRPGFKSTAVYFEGWRKKKRATTTDDNEYWRWRTFTFPRRDHSRYAHAV